MITSFTCWKWVESYPNNRPVHWTIVNTVFASIKDRRTNRRSNHNLYCSCYYPIIVINADTQQTDDNLITGQSKSMKCCSLYTMMKVSSCLYTYYKVFVISFIMVILVFMSITIAQNTATGSTMIYSIVALYSIISIYSTFSTKINSESFIKWRINEEGRGSIGLKLMAAY